MRSSQSSRVSQFAEPGDIEPAALARAVYFDLAEGAEPAALVQFLFAQVGLPPADAQDIVGQENAKLQELMLHVAERLERDADPVDLADELVERDWPGALAHTFVTRVEQEICAMTRSAAGREQLLAASRRRMVTGFAWFGGGVLVTWFTQIEADRRGSGYSLIPWGAVLYGLALMGMGAWRWMQHKTREVA